jgi:GNAT superfamily N-acetyltransferase/ABC-type uncharacterized transport system YnjBCD ATPase subunit
MFDVPPSEKSTVEWDVNLPLDEQPWHVGLIVGPSGSGKSTVARELFGGDMVGALEWPSDRAIIDAFPSDMGTREVVAALNSVGLGSPPAWLRPFHVLSNGEQFRATVARALAERRDRMTVIDEFTSVVDRRVAQIGSAAVAKAVRRANQRFVAVTCHYDVLDWLQPDWVFEPHANSFAWRSVQPRPKLSLEVRRVDRAAWRVFKHHHYLSGELLASAKCYGGFIDDQCVAFAAVRVFPHAHRTNIIMGHRLVVQPDWQGLGIGGRIDDALGAFLYQRGWAYHNVVAHPAMKAYYSRSPRWKLHSASVKPSTGRRSTISLGKSNNDPRKLSTSTFVYVPPAGTPRPTERVPYATL